MAVIMIVGLVPLGAITAFAEDTVTEYYALDVGAGAYIDTGYVPTKDTCIVMDVELNNQETALFGCILHSGDTHNFYVNASGDNVYGLSDYGSGYGKNSASWAGNAYVKGRQTVELAKNEFKVNGEVKATHNYGDFSGQSSLTK